MDTNSEQRLQTICLLILTTFAGAAAFYLFRQVMIPFVLAVFLMFAINPLIEFLTQRVKAPRPLAVAAVFLAGFLLFPIVATLISSSLGQLAGKSDLYREQIVRIAQEGAALVDAERFNIDVEGIREQLSALPIGTMLVRLTNAIIEILSNAVLVLIFLVFLLLGEGQASRTSPVWGEIQSRIERYIVTKVVLSAVTGALVGIILYALGVDLALVFGFMAFLLNFIPSIGSIIATLLPLPVLLTSPDVTWVTVVLALALPGAVQLVIGNFIDPRTMGQSLNLHPVVILIGLIFWGVLWGIVGMLLATPIMAVFKILLEQSELTQPVARLMEGRLGEPPPPPEPEPAEGA
jgi:AI-2 transport protein TqsA